MSARKLFYHKETRGDVILEMVIWQLPEKSIERPHQLKETLNKSRFVIPAHAGIQGNQQTGPRPSPG